jgi:hypothetical protein
VTSPYDLQHPLLTPERYPASPHTHPSHVRALHIHQHRSTSPDVIYDTPETIKKNIFGGLTTRCLHFSAGFHMYILNAQGVLLLGENVLATHLMRHHYLLDFGFYFPDTIYGDVLIFGTSTVNRDFSVPYPVVEQLIHLYAKI